MTYKKEVAKRRERAEEDAAATRAALARDLGNVEARLTRLTTAFVDGDIERELFLKTKERLQAEKAEIEEKQAELAANPAAYLDRVAEVLELAKDPLFSYETGDPHEKRVLLEKLSSNRTLSGKELGFALQDPFPEIAFSGCVLNLCPLRDKSRTSVGNLCRVRQVCPLRDKNRTYVGDYCRPRQMSQSQATTRKNTGNHCQGRPAELLNDLLHRLLDWAKRHAP